MPVADPCSRAVVGARHRQLWLALALASSSYVGDAIQAALYGSFQLMHNVRQIPQ
jgi:hypothetical protein